jgi:hypothetical protein
LLLQFSDIGLIVSTEAKQCALIAVDEMYDVASENNNVNQLNFLVDVKQEIINL